ncbi:ras-related protein Rab-18A-like [Wyeomyia smithii]|uniref:ras-related protein Rab-18A-like n=1 Tax=Wyeomyia smithii TaxID=174621 RepID=UPI002467FEFD|nr:ras-related protein Rab-18A-like [Wyeomyia smithii]
MSQDEKLRKFEVILLGDNHVGKSCLINAFNTLKFNILEPTINVGFTSKVVDVDGSAVRLGIWDTAGQERFRSMTANYYRRVQGTLLVYDIGERKSFSSLDSWLDDLDRYRTCDKMCKILVGNKTDSSARVISTDEGRRFATRHQMLFAETSAKNNTCVKDAFLLLVREMMKIALAKEKEENEMDIPEMKLEIDADLGKQKASGSCSC